MHRVRTARLVASKKTPRPATESLARRPLGRGGPLAILATDPVIYGRACTYATLGRGTLPVEVFRDLDKAEEWLTPQPKATPRGGA